MGNQNKLNIKDKLGKAVYSAKNSLQNLQDILDYTPKYFSQKINFQDYNQEVISTDPKEVIHVYIGKIAKDEELRKQSIYNDEFVLGIIEEVLEKCEYETTLEIHLGPEMSKYFNGENDIVGYMNVNEEIAYIKNLLQSKRLKKKYRKRASRIVYKDLCDISDAAEHGTLFESLKKDGVEKIFKKNIKPEITIQDINSLNLSQYLWWVFNHNNKFKKQIKNIVPKRLRDGNNTIYIYPITEIAIRLTDFLQGNHIQGGANKQYDYDRIINMILFGENLEPQLPELSELQNILRQTTDYGDFKTFYFNTQGFSKHKKELSKTDKLKSKIRTTTLVIAGLFTAFGAGRYMTLKNIKQKKQNEINQILRNTIRNNEVSLDEIDKKTNAVYTIFNNIYEEVPGHEKELKSLIKSVIIEYENDDKLKYYVDFYSAHPDRFYYKPRYFIEQAIVSKYAMLLKERGYELIKNKWLREYEDKILASLELVKKEKIKVRKTRGDEVLLGGYKDLKQIGSIEDNNYTTYSLALRYGSYILASTDFYNGEGTFSLENTKKAILLYIKQTYPSIEGMAHKIRYKHRFGKGTDDEWADYNDIKLELFSYFIKTGKIEDLRERRPYGNFNKVQQMQYIDEFAKENPKFMKEHNLSEIPGERLLTYKQAIFNSIQLVKNNKSKFRDSLRIIEDNNGEQAISFNKKYLGSYLMSNGEEYVLFKIDHNHKEYILPYSYEKGSGGFSIFNTFYKDRKQTRVKFQNK